MSVKVMTAVFDRYPNGGGEMLLALALADHASDDGSRIFPSVEQLAEKTRQSVRSVQYQLRRMQDAGWLILVNAGNGGRQMHSEYRISLDWIKGAEIAPFKKGANDDLKGAIHDGNGAIHDKKGCNPRQETVQRVAPLNNRHRTIIGLRRCRAEAQNDPGNCPACRLHAERHGAGDGKGSGPEHCCRTGCV